MDIFDKATELEEAERDACVARAREAASAQAARGSVITLQCLTCGERIEPARIKALRGVTTCIDCATRAERPRP